MEPKSKLAFLMLICVFVSMAVNTAHTSPAAKLAIEPTVVKDIAVGSTFTVNVTITDVSELYGWQANITFNPQVLNVESTSEGPFLKQVNETIFLKKIDNQGGFALIMASLKQQAGGIYPPHGAAGSGKLASITFAVKSAGSSPLHFETNGTKLKTLYGVSIIDIWDVSPPVDGSFGNPSGGWLSGIPLEWIGGIVAVVAVSGIVAFMLLRRRKRPKLTR